MQQQPKRRWSNGWYGFALMLALLVFGLGGLDSKKDSRLHHGLEDRFALPVSVYPAQSDRILL